MKGYGLKHQLLNLFIVSKLSTQLIRRNVRKKSSYVGVFCILINNQFADVHIKNVSLLYFSCVKGKLVEVNERLLSNPDLLLQKVCYFNFSIF